MAVTTEAARMPSSCPGRLTIGVGPIGTQILALQIVRAKARFVPKADHRTFRKSDLNTYELLGAQEFGVGANMAFAVASLSDIGLFDVALDVALPTGWGRIRQVPSSDHQGTFVRL